jgi:hypothetical protein
MTQSEHASITLRCPARIICKIRGVLDDLFVFDGRFRSLECVLVDILRKTGAERVGNLKMAPGTRPQTSAFISVP